LASSINIAAYSDALVILGTAGVVVPLVQRLGFSPVLAYIGAGAILGPLGLGSFVSKFPPLHWFTVSDIANVSGIADLGVVFLLFLIGLELSLERLKTMRRLVFGLGTGQILSSAAAIATIVAMLGARPSTALLLGLALALSSTAIVIELLARQGRLTTSAGRATFAILLAQDVAVVPILMLVAVLGADQAGPLWQTVALALLQAAIAIAAIVMIGRLILRPLFRSVAQTDSSELFIAAILFVIVATGVAAALAGLSMALGAFVAGLLLAETEYRHAIAATIEPFKGLLLGLFFFTVGMSLDLGELARSPLLLLASVVGLVVVKAAITIALGRLYRLSWASSIEAGLLLGPGGEFAFVAIGLAAALGVIPARTAAYALAVTSLSMIAIPLLAHLARRIRPMIEGHKPADPALALSPSPQSRHALVIGFGRVGAVVADMLDAHRVPYTAIEDNAVSVIAARNRGKPVYYGTATNADFLKACGIMDASAVVITIHARDAIDAVIREVRRLRPDISIIARARDAAHAGHLYTLGVTDAVPETVEASLQLSEAALVGVGVPTGPVIASIHQKRDDFRLELQKAAEVAGRRETRSIRAKTTSKPKPAPPTL
jgi:CPA2 family monovalent cation:H+ antiporter-2